MHQVQGEALLVLDLPAPHLQQEKKKLMVYSRMQKMKRKVMTLIWMMIKKKMMKTYTWNLKMMRPPIMQRVNNTIHIN